MNALCLFGFEHFDRFHFKKRLCGKWLLFLSSPFVHRYCVLDKQASMDENLWTQCHVYLYWTHCFLSLYQVSICAGWMCWITRTFAAHINWWIIFNMIVLFVLRSFTWQNFSMNHVMWKLCKKKNQKLKRYWLGCGRVKAPRVIYFSQCFTFEQNV